MTALSRIVHANLQELDRRLALRRPLAYDDDAVVDVVLDSVMSRSVVGVARVWSMAAQNSRGIAWVRAAIAEWTRSRWSDRARAAGTGLLAAAIVHLGLTLLAGAPQSWLWLIIPGMAISAGLLLLAASWQQRPQEPLH